MSSSSSMPIGSSALTGSSSISPFRQPTSHSGATSPELGARAQTAFSRTHSPIHGESSSSSCSSSSSFCSSSSSSYASPSTVDHVVTIRPGATFSQMDDSFFFSDFSSFGSIEEAFSKTDRKPQEKGLDQLVGELKKFFNKYEGYDLTGRELRLFDDVIRALTSPSDKTAVLNYAIDLCNVFIDKVVPKVKLPKERSIPSKDQFTPTEYHKRAHCLVMRVEELKGLVGAILSVTRHAPSEQPARPLSKGIINIQHLIEPGSRGFHLCPVGHPMRSKLIDVRSSSNSVFQANFPVDSSGKTKSSTFFPLENADEVVALIDSAEMIAKSENRFLCRVAGKPFLIEIYKEGPVIKSAFPIFFHAECDLNEELSIVEGESPVTGMQLLLAAEKAIEAYNQPTLDPNPWNPIRYTIDDKLVIDLGPFLPHLGVSQGILVEFPRSFFEKDLIANAIAHA